MSPASDPLLHILVPVYNGGDFLRECLGSVLAQTYGNWRCTVIDNRSTDDTPAIASEFAARDPRLRVVTTETFLPLIQNHNRALGLVEPDARYVKPLMADDWLEPRCLEKLAACAQAAPQVGLVCCAARSGPERVLFDNLPHPEGAVSYLSGRDAARLALLTDRYFFGSPTTMLIRADLVRKRRPFYNPENLQADEEACYDLLRESEFAFVHEPLAHVRMHARSHTAATLPLFSLASCHAFALAKYGPDYLTAPELAARLRQRLREYYARLALGALERRGPEFWEFHRRMLAMIGYPLSRWRLARAILAHVVRRLTSPRGLAQGVMARVHAAKPPPSQ